MATFKERAGLVENPTVNSVVAMAAATVALDMIEEQGTDSDQRRVALATAVINDPITQAERMTVFVVVDNAIADKALSDRSDVTLDADIVKRLREVRSKLAGIGTAA